MGCKNYSCPVVVPQGLPGVSVPGSNGSDGVALLANTCNDIGIANQIGTTIVASYTMPGDTVAAKDILKGEAMLIVPMQFNATVAITLKVGSGLIGTKTFTVVPDIVIDIAQTDPPPVAYTRMKLNFTLLMKNGATIAMRDAFLTLMGLPFQQMAMGWGQVALNAAEQNTFTVEVTLNNASDVISCYYFTLEHYKYPV